MSKKKAQRLLGQLVLKHGQVVAAIRSYFKAPSGGSVSANKAAARWDERAAEFEAVCQQLQAELSGEELATRSARPELLPRELQEKAERAGVRYLACMGMTYVLTERRYRAFLEAKAAEHDTFPAAFGLPLDGPVINVTDWTCDDARAGLDALTQEDDA